jgi:hypothetical protein
VRNGSIAERVFVITQAFSYPLLSAAAAAASTLRLREPGEVGLVADYEVEVGLVGQHVLAELREELRAPG